MSAVVFAALDLWRRELPLPLAVASGTLACLLVTDLGWSALGMTVGAGLVTIAFGRQQIGGDLRGAAALGAWLGPWDTALALVMALATVMAFRRHVPSPIPLLPILAGSVLLAIALRIALEKP